MTNTLTKICRLSLISYLWLSTAAYAEIYSWTDDAGNVIYSDQKASNKAKATQPSANVSYYSAVKPATAQRQEAPSALGELATLSVEEESSDSSPAPLSEKECQQQYRRSCDEVVNWQKHAVEKCGNDSRCKDAGFLERKYRPRTTEEVLAIARRSASRNNLLDKRITQFLNKKYTRHCESQAAMYCQKNRSRQCEANMLRYCKDPRSLEDVFRRYDNLSIIERQQIIAKAKQLAIANGDSALDYEKMLVSIVDILISQALMGI